MKNLHSTAYEYKLKPEDISVKKKVVAKNYPIHWHDFYEIEIVIDGKGVHGLNGQDYPMKKGCVYMLSPTDYHDLTIEEDVTLYNLAFIENLLSDEFLQMLSENSNENNIFYFNDADLNEITNMCDMMSTELNRSKQYKNEFLKNILECLLILILRKAHIDNSSADTNEKDYIKKAILYMQLHFKDNPSLAETAQAVNLNPSYFSHMFKNSFGKTYIEHLTEIKLSYSKKLLRTSDLSVTEVCFNSGFSSLSNFLKVFKEKTGRSPSMYAKEKKSKRMQAEN